MNSIDIINLIEKKGFTSLEDIYKLNEGVSLNPYDAIDTITPYREKPAEERKIDELNRILIVNNLALKNNFEFLGTIEGNKERLSTNESLLFKCDKGHVVEDTYKKLSKRDGGLCCSGCKTGSVKIALDKYASKEENLRKIQDFAQQSDFKLLSTEYQGHKGKHDFQCSEGHNFQDTVVDINRRSGDAPMCCPGCQNKKIISEINQYAEAKGGILLTENYKNQDIKLNFMCAEGHEVNLSKKQIDHGRWCDCCDTSKFKTENKIKMFVEVFFMENFSKSRDEWNINTIARKAVTVEAIHSFLKSKRSGSKENIFSYKKQPMELDIFNKELNVAFEYNGEFHYELNPKIKNNTVKQLERLVKYQSNDFAKARNCEKMGIKLFSIPVMKDYDTKIFDRALNHFINHCKSQGLEVSYTDSQLNYMKEKFHHIKNGENHATEYKNFMKATKSQRLKASI